MRAEQQVGSSRAFHAAGRMMAARSNTEFDEDMQLTTRIRKLFDTKAKAATISPEDPGIDWLRIWPFILLHVIAIWALFQGASAAALVACAVSYFIRMFAITAFFHRGLSHKAFRMTSRTRFWGSLLATAATQRGPIWWVAHHRHHHQHADTDLDSHSPKHGFWHSHCGWFLSKRGFHAPSGRTRDLEKHPDLVWMDRFDLLVAAGYGVLWFAFGALLAWAFPSLKTSALEMFLWGYVVSTILLIHATLAINSLAHVWGTRDFETRDDSRNNPLLALLTLGEGWHNNHHRFPASARQGLTPFQVDITWLILKGMSRLGWVSDLRTVSPERTRQAQAVPHTQQPVQQGEPT